MFFCWLMLEWRCAEIVVAFLDFCKDGETCQFLHHVDVVIFHLHVAADAVAVHDDAFDVEAASPGVFYGEDAGVDAAEGCRGDDQKRKAKLFHDVGEEYFFVVVTDGTDDAAGAFHKYKFMALGCCGKIGLDLREFHRVAFLAGGQVRGNCFLVDVADQFFLSVGEVCYVLDVVGIAGDPLAVFEFCTAEGCLVVTGVNAGVSPFLYQKGGHKSLAYVGACCCNEITLGHN